MRPRAPSWLPEALLLSAVVFGPLAFGAVEVWSRALLQMDLFLLLGACALRGAPLPNSPVYKTLLPAFLVVWAAAAVQWWAPHSSIGPASLLPFTASARATGRDLLLWTAYASLLWSAPQVLASRAALRRFVWTLFLLGAFIAVVGIIQRGQGNTAFYGLRPVRQGFPFGPYPNRDHAASMMVMAALAGLGLLLSRWPEFKARGGERLADFVASQAAAFFLLGIVLFGIISSLSRGAFNSLFAALWLTGLSATVFIKSRGLRRTARAAAVLGIPAYLAFLWFHPMWIGYIFKTPDLSVA
ncbi:MAG: hypothetical protein KGL74_01260, partial [Elusimicrobia bacterium]|nr:hypothetical protein [Elusimicrobiota bacterium]